MKKFTRLVASATALLLLLLVGCNNAVSNAIVDFADRSIAADRLITFSLSSNSNLMNFDTPIQQKGNSRTIMPTAYICSDLKFFYSYKKQGESTHSTPVEIDVFANASGKDGQVIINLEAAQYEFIMYALNSSETSFDANKVLLKATASADIRTTDTVNFFMTADESKVPGHVSLKLYTNGWTISDAYDVKADLRYTKTTTIETTEHKIDTKILNTEVLLFHKDTDSEKDITLLTNTAPENANYAPKTTEAPVTDLDILPGTYNFTVYVIDKNNTKNTFVWSDRIVVLPGKTTEKTLGIPNIIGVTPTKPSSLTATYTDPDNTYTGYYQTQFTWGDASNNEQFFELQVVEFNGNDSSIVQPAANETQNADEVWDDLLSTNSAKIQSNIIYGTQTSEVTWVTSVPNAEYKLFYGHPENGYCAGAVTKNNTSATMYLLLGSRYIARIRAINAAGASEWTYATLDTASTGKFPSTTINRYRLTYALLNGSFYKPESTSTLEDPQPTTVFYHSQSASGIPIIQPNGKNTAADGETPVYNQLLKYNDKIWSTWRAEYHADGSSSDSGTLQGYYNSANLTDAPAPYTGCANIALTACYETVGSITLFDDNDYAIGTITCTNKEFSITNQEALEMKVSLTTDASTETLIWSIAYPRAKAYESVSIQIVSTDGKKAFYLQNPTYNAERSAATFTIPYKTYGEGIYNAMILAYSKVKPKDPYQKTIVLNITQ